MNSFVNYWEVPIFLLVLFYITGCAETKIAPGQTPALRTTTEPEEALKKSVPNLAAISNQRVWFVSSDKLLLRVCAGLNCKVSATLVGGDELFQTGEKGKWVRVRVKATRKEGWVSSIFIGKEPPPDKAGSTPPQKAPMLK
jgi:hypothetical protein